MHQLTPSETALLTAETNTNLGHQSLCLELAPNADGAHLSLASLRELRRHGAPTERPRSPLGTLKQAMSVKSTSRM